MMPLGPPPPGTIWIERRKWPDTPHHAWCAAPLGADEHGDWFALRKGWPVMYRKEPVETSWYDRVLVVPPGAYWIGLWTIMEAGIELYCDIATPARRERDRLVVIDLDLDLVRRPGEPLLTDDEDEFELHRISLGYPTDVVDAARTAVQELRVAIESGAEPFATSCLRWLAAL